MRKKNNITIGKQKITTQKMWKIESGKKIQKHKNNWNTTIKSLIQSRKDQSFLGLETEFFRVAAIFLCRILV